MNLRTCGECAGWTHDPTYTPTTLQPSRIGKCPVGCGMAQEDAGACMNFNPRIEAGDLPWVPASEAPDDIETGTPIAVFAAGRVFRGAGRRDGAWWVGADRYSRELRTDVTHYIIITPPRPQ